MKQTADRPLGGRYPQVSLAGVRVDRVDGHSAKELLRPLLKEPSCQHVITAHTQYLREAASDPQLREIVNTAALVIPDGMPVVWAARLSGAPVGQRLTGHDLVQALVELSSREGVSLFFLGAAPGVGERAARNLRQRYPSVRIAGVYSPPVCPYPFPKEEDRHMVEVVNASGADAVMVALGCPKQDMWVAAHREELRVSIALGVGCVLDALAGVVTRAPGWLQVAGLEWLHRLYQEPGRLWRRYLLDFAFLFPLLLRSALARLASSGGVDR